MKNYNAIEDAHRAEDGLLINIPGHFKYNKMIYKEYDIKEFEGELYAIAKDPVLYQNEFSNQNDRQDTYLLGEAILPINCKNGDLLFSLLKLKTKMEKNKSLRLNKKNQELIIKWCKKYGFPFEGRLSDINRCKQDNLWMKNKLLGFSMNDFMSMLRKINMAFYMYLKIKDIDNKKNISGLSIEDCTKMLKQEFESLELFAHFDFEKLEYVSVVNNLFQAAMYQLMLFSLLKRIDDAFIGIALCKCCNAPFPPSRRNKKYCENCSPQKAYKRKQSKKL